MNIIHSPTIEQNQHEGLLLRFMRRVHNVARTVPVRRARSAPFVAAVASDNQHTVLLVPSTSPLLQLHRRSLEAAGFRVVVAREWQELRAVAHEHHPHLVVLDAELRQNAAFAWRALLFEVEAPAIVVAAEASQEEQIEALESGAAGHLSGSFTSAELIARVRAILRRTSPLVGS